MGAAPLHIHQFLMSGGQSRAHNIDGPILKAVVKTIR